MDYDEESSLVSPSPPAPRRSFRSLHFVEPAVPPTMRELLSERHLELAEQVDDDSVPPRVVATDSASRIALYERIQHEQAAWRIQAAFRMQKFGRMTHFDDNSHAIIQALGLDEGAALERPSLEIAKETARDMLPHRDDGELFSFDEGLSAFDGFGVEVATYMRFIVYVGRVCWIALLLNLSNIISNLDGGRIDDLL